MRMIERGDGAGFALEALGELAAEILIATERSRRGVVCLVHVTHGARSDGSPNFVGTEPVSR